MKNQNRKELLAAYKERKVIGGICSIQNIINGRMYLAAVNDLQGYKNRYDFAQINGICIDLRIKSDYEKFGKEAFEFVVLEELVKKETQTDKEFSDDVKTLKEIWLEKIDPDKLY